MRRMGIFCMGVLMHPIVVASAVFSYRTVGMAIQRFLFTAGFLGVLLGALPLRPLHAQTPLDKLQADFANPPAGAKPMMRWWWFGLAVEKPEIRRELEQMKADGIGGGGIGFFFSQVLDEPAGLGEEAVLSEAVVGEVGHAARQGRPPGGRVGVSLGRG